MNCLRCTLTRFLVSNKIVMFEYSTCIQRMLFTPLSIQQSETMREYPLNWITSIFSDSIFQICLLSIILYYLLQQLLFLVFFFSEINKIYFILNWRKQKHFFVSVPENSQTTHYHSTSLNALILIWWRQGVRNDFARADRSTTNAHALDYWNECVQRQHCVLIKIRISS